MSKMSPNEMAKTLAKGLLSFPVTHFDKDFRFQEGALTANIAPGCSALGASTGASCRRQLGVSFSP